ncbi:ATP-binding protein [Polynucleobacter paneuropaeus]|nr:ATP-binding protein [Polynucleobacter paneuropaeus]MBT8638564.1 ATP-binding protein [Polynucleobacter paneuropaeus]
MADQVGFKPTAVNPMGLSALIRNLGRDCTPDQYIREFVKNSIEACQRTGLANRKIVLDLNHGIANKSNIYKLSFIDNGDGMSLEQMNNLLNNLSASGSTANEFANYGVGAKIASLTRNHFGVHYESWKGGEGHSILIRYNPKFDVFGIQGFPDGKDGIMYSRKLDPASKPTMMDGHGTCVTLFGMSLEQDTMGLPSGMKGDANSWLLDYLNRRFFTLPEQIEILVRVGYAQDKSKPNLHYLAKATGFAVLANAQSQARGELDLIDAKAYWWILKPDATLSGQTALINQGEVFDVGDARSNRLAHFGILVGRNRVMIMIEPKDAVQNTARTNLVKLDGSVMNWSAWQDEFRMNMPSQINEFINSLLRETSQVSHKKAILMRLSALKALFLLGDYKHLKIDFKKTAPPAMADDEDLSVVMQLAQDSAPNPAPPGDAAAKPQAPQTPAPEEPLEEEDNLFPQVEWTSEDRSPQLAGKAAEYNELTNVVLANRDFKGFADLVQYFSDKYAGTSNLDQVIVNSTNEAIEQALMECVAGALSLRGKTNWTAQQVNVALSPEALTTALMQRYWMVSYVDQVIRQHLLQVRTAV